MKNLHESEGEVKAACLEIIQFNPLLDFFLQTLLEVFVVVGRYLLVGLYCGFLLSILDLILETSGTADLCPTAGYHLLLLTGTLLPSPEESRLLVES